MYVYCIYPAKSKSPETTAKLSKKSRNKHCSICFWWCHLWSLHLYCYNFLPQLSMNQVLPEKAISLSVTVNNEKIYLLNEIW